VAEREGDYDIIIASQGRGKVVEVKPVQRLGKYLSFRFWLSLLRASVLRLAGATKRGQVSAQKIASAQAGADKYLRHQEVIAAYVKMLDVRDRLIAPGKEDFEKFKDIYAETQDILKKLLQAQGLDPEGYEFYLADSASPNAFVLRYSNVLVVNLGLLRMLAEKNASRDALAFILAHEITHIMQGRAEIDSGQADLNKGLLVSHIEDRAKEYHADLAAVALMDKAGFSVREATVAFNALLEWMEARKVKDSVWGNHPDLEERIRRLDRLVLDFHWANYVADPTPVSAAFIRQSKRRSRYREFQERVIKVSTAAELEILLREAATPDELQFAFLIGHEMLPAAEQSAHLTQLRQVMKERTAEFAGSAVATRILLEYQQDDVFIMAQRSENASARLENFKRLADSLDEETILEIIEQGIPGLFTTVIDVDSLEADARHTKAKNILLRLATSSISLSGGAQMPADRFNMFATGFLDPMMKKYLGNVSRGQIPWEQVRRMLKGLQRMLQEVNLTSVVRGDMRVNTHLFDLAESMLRSDVYAETMDAATAMELIEIYDRASRLGGGYGTRFTTASAAIQLHDFILRANPETREALLNWVLKGEQASDLRNELFKLDIERLAEGKPTLVGPAVPAVYLDAMLQNKYMWEHYSDAFQLFLDKAAKNAGAQELCAYYKKILNGFREHGINKDAGIFQNLRSRMASDPVVFAGDVFDRVLEQALAPEIRSRIMNARRELKPLFFVFALGGTMDAGQLRRFVFGKWGRDTRGSMLVNRDIALMILRETPELPLEDAPADIIQQVEQAPAITGELLELVNEHFNALPHERRTAIRKHWNEVNPPQVPHNVRTEEFGLLTMFFDAWRLEGSRKAKGESEKAELEQGAGAYLTPIYLQNLFNHIGHPVRLEEEDVHYPANLWRVFMGDVSEHSSTEQAHHLEAAAAKRPNQATRFNLKNEKLPELLALFGFLDKLPQDYEAAVQQVLASLPASVFRNFVLHQLFVDRILRRELGMAVPAEQTFDYKALEAKIADLTGPQQSLLLTGLQRILPHFISDTQMETNNGLLWGNFMQLSMRQATNADQNRVRQEHAAESGNYEDAAHAIPGGVLAQLDIFLGRLAGKTLAEVLGSPASLAVKRTAIEAYFPRPSLERDRWLQLALETSGQQKDLSEIEKILGIFFNPSLRESAALQALDQYRSINPADFENLDSALAAIRRFYPEPSPLRDDILQETAQYLARTPKDLAKINALYADSFKNIEKLTEKEGAQVVFGQDVFRTFIKSRSPQDKSEFLLWMLGVREQKPFFMVEAEHRFHVNFDSLRNQLMPQQSQYYPEAGITSQREFLAPFLYGEKSVFSDPSVAKEFLDQLFAAMVPAGENQGIIKVFYDAIFKHADKYRREEIFLSLLRTLGQQRQKAAELEPQEREAQFVRAVMQSLGLVGVKAAQLSGIPALRGLKDRAPRLNKGVVFDLIAKLAGRFEDKYQSLDAPVGSASIKVVYRARLADGRMVAVKIKRPDVEKLLEQDMIFLRKVLDEASPALRDGGYAVPRGLIDRVEAIVREELDFNREFANSKRLRKNLGPPNILRRLNIVRFFISRAFLRLGENIFKVRGRGLAFQVPKPLEVVGN
ncbi:M48 family metalloprotease, partial [candidate division FCPU426 bacterium]|nr:M48 family metalloprotease [candidate division FCPU426 bacterium]